MLTTRLPFFRNICSRLGRTVLALAVLPAAFCCGLGPASANIPGGGTGSGPNVTVTDNGDGTVTMANGIASIVIVKEAARLKAISYTYNNSGTPATKQLLANSGWYPGLACMVSTNFSCPPIRSSVSRSRFSLAC